MFWMGHDGIDVHSLILVHVTACQFFFEVVSG